MSGLLTDPRVLEAVETLRTATREIARAARGGDAESIRQAIEKRGTAVDALARVLRDTGDGLSREQVESLAIQADEAESSLRGLQSQVAAELRSLWGLVRVARGYATSPVDPSSLDRSG